MKFVRPQDRQITYWRNPPKIIQVSPIISNENSWPQFSEIIPLAKLAEFEYFTKWSQKYFSTYCFHIKVFYPFLIFPFVTDHNVVETLLFSFEWTLVSCRNKFHHHWPLFSISFPSIVLPYVVSFQSWSIIWLFCAWKFLKTFSEGWEIKHFSDFSIASKTKKKPLSSDFINGLLNLTELLSFPFDFTKTYINFSNVW